MLRVWNFLVNCIQAGADEQELATPILRQFLQTDLFLVHLFFCERKAVPVQ